ncbi:uncharacterized protein [Rutidosis leptorrhynchoides]|uniref:uncharacterized protein isoform X2 n=1 Tax=Rutidosis leptorrhynchoides TaxID=125765 RepID=UPI003A99223C
MSARLKGDRKVKVKRHSVVLRHETLEQTRRLNLDFAEEYVALKESCSHMFHVVGSGRFVTARVITSNGKPIRDPVVFLGTDYDDVSTPQDQETVSYVLAVGPNPETVVTREHDKEVIQWKLALHQIGYIWNYKHFLLLSCLSKLKEMMYNICQSELVFFNICQP